jgi:hypothetical protein
MKTISSSFANEIIAFPHASANKLIQALAAECDSV